MMVMNPFQIVISRIPPRIYACNLVLSILRSEKLNEWNILFFLIF